MPARAATTTVANPCCKGGLEQAQCRRDPRPSLVKLTRRGETALTGDPLRYQPSTKPIDREPRGYPFVRKENEALLRTTLVDARVEHGEYDLILRWIAKGEFGTAAVVASWIAQASRYGTSNTADNIIHSAPADPQARDADRDRLIETPVESPVARYASAKQTRAALRRRQDASGTGRGPDDVAQPRRAI
jgi:hypothetical protein